MSTFNPLSGIRGTPVGFTCSRNAWPLLFFDLAVRAVGSAPTGQRALLLAITYRSTLWARTSHVLSQPQHDVELMKKYLLETGKWSESDITVLTDAKGTPDDRLPTHANIMREIKLLGSSNCQNAFFLYTGHADQRRQPQSTQSRAVPKGAPGRRLVEEFDQFIIPTDAVTGPGLKDINPDLVILDDDLHDCLISTLPPRSTFLAILDTCHSATLFDLKHHRCNRTRSLKSLLRRSVRKVVVEPLSEFFGRATDGGFANADSFNASDPCNGMCPRRKTPICPIAVTISACKDQQQVYENGSSLTETIVRILRSKPTAGLPDVIDAVLNNYKLQRNRMKNMEKRYKKEGNTVMMHEMHEMRLQANRLMPEVASTAALDLSRHHSWSGLAMRNDR
ncbi:caspase domain-containing protein [Coprinopsis sp. MPI-PUGE-AT-0042]|nr:caspase domain-containing protein [Coprinopsis sp. MPI-PUGE-AT-0042]